MANICEFSMALRGKKENIEEFLQNMQQTKEPYMGRGATISETDWDQPDDNGNVYVVIGGNCKWSVRISLIDDAVSMRTKPEIWSFGPDVRTEDLSFATLIENCKRLSISMEVYSQEVENLFEEHIRYLAETGETTEECRGCYGNDETGGFVWDFDI